MNETINLMKAHTSVRRFTEERFRIRNYVLSLMLGGLRPAGRISSLTLSLWCEAKRKKKPSLTWCPKKPFGSLQPSCFLLETSIVPKKAFTCIRKTFILRGRRIS